MANESPRAKGKNRPKSLLSLLRRDEPEEEVEFVTVKKHKKKLKRVVKLKPMARRHMSEAFVKPEVTEKDIGITEMVLEKIAPAVGTLPAGRSEAFFTCVQCGMQIPKSVERCPKCNAHYLKDVPEEAVQELDDAESSLPEDAEEILHKKGIPMIHFDAESGTIRYLEEDTREPDFMAECSYCGTVVEFDTDRCPICGKKFEAGDTGIVSLVADSAFDEGCDEEIDCPSCGEHVNIIKGRCPACMEVVHDTEKEGPDSKVAPVIRGDNVVFLHLDVESGELNYLQRLANKLGFEELTIQLERIGRGGFDKDWQSLSRV
ncbi:MAG: hypothetical protein ACUVT7_08110 [Thermoplasmata archaeon]